MCLSQQVRNPVTSAERMGVNKEQFKPTALGMKTISKYFIYMSYKKIKYSKDTAVLGSTEQNPEGPGTFKFHISK